MFSCSVHGRSLDRVYRCNAGLSPVEHSPPWWQTSPPGHLVFRRDEEMSGGRRARSLIDGGIATIISLKTNNAKGRCLPMGSVAVASVLISWMQTK